MYILYLILHITISFLDRTNRPCILDHFRRHFEREEHYRGKTNHHNSHGETAGSQGYLRARSDANVAAGLHLQRYHLVRRAGRLTSLGPRDSYHPFEPEDDSNASVRPLRRLVIQAGITRFQYRDDRASRLHRSAQLGTFVVAQQSPDHDNVRGAGRPDESATPGSLAQSHLPDP